MPKGSAFMPTKTNPFAALFWLLTAGLFAAGVAIVFLWTPSLAPNDSGGEAQKIFYLHLPVAINSFLACLINFIACVGYLSKRRQIWDDLAQAAAQVAVLLLSVVLLTGMIWGKSAWGHWWTWWSQRLTLSLVLWLLYVVYLVLRQSIPSAQRCAVVAAVYGSVAFLDVPLVYLSTRLMKDVVHPKSAGLDPDMKITLAFWFIPVTLFTLGLIRARYNTLVRRSQTQAALRAAENEPSLSVSRPGGVM